LREHWEKLLYENQKELSCKFMVNILDITSGTILSWNCLIKES
jgi:hypothetical protein